jgi:hypothetical protein
MTSKQIQLFLCIVLFFPAQILCQQRTDLQIYTRYSFYTDEEAGEALLHILPSLADKNLEIELKVNGSSICTWRGKPQKRLLRLPFIIGDSLESGKLEASITDGSGMKFSASGDLVILKHKPNEVKTDRLTGGLIVDKRRFFPFGFYCYSPVYPTLPEEEVVKGFNMISPYQKILPESFKDRKAYMDRCAQLGMKVHYNLLSVSGGGGVGSKIEELSDARKRELLRQEIEAFRDHPALLAWYIADEPTGNRMTPDSLEKIYEFIKETDPWHPVSIVFMAPFSSAKKYSEALDIVMADPYPVPRIPISMVGDVAKSLSADFRGKSPVWIVPQAFGGGELWEREPTLQELRSMTYQSIINGARGIQYFVRQGLNLFPKSTGAWNECGRMAVEIAELTPWLLSDEETIPVSSGSPSIIVTSAVSNDQLMIMAVNKSNAPVRADFRIGSGLTTTAKAIFENRNVQVNAGYFSDYLSAFGSQVYMIRLKPLSVTIKPWRYNLILDPGFEDLSTPGVPSACYARGNGDRGATYFPDPQEYIEGNHSVRLVTPTENSSIKLRFFPVRVRPGATYMVSVYAKTNPEQRITADSNINKPRYFEISLGEFGSTSFTLEKEWKEFVTFVTIPFNNELPPKMNLILQMPSAGVGWFDMVQVMECIDIKQSINPDLIINTFL